MEGFRVDAGYAGAQDAYDGYECGYRRQEDDAGDSDAFGPTVGAHLSSFPFAD